MFNSQAKQGVLKANRSISGNSSGFSLIELMIAMAILAFGMLAAASMQYSAISKNTKGNIYTQANMLAKIKLEDELVAGNYNDPTMIDDNEQPPAVFIPVIG